MHQKDLPSGQPCYAANAGQKGKTNAKLFDSSELRQLMTGKEAACFDVWFPMETAPRDGSEILCFTVAGDYEIAHWLPVTQCWVSKRGILVEPSRWMRLPNSPAPGGHDETHVSR